MVAQEDEESLKRQYAKIAIERDGADEGDMVTLGYTKYRMESQEASLGNMRKDGKSCTMTTISDRNYGVVVKEDESEE